MRKWDGLVNFINEEAKTEGSYVKCAESREDFVWASVSVWFVHEHMAPGMIVHIHGVMFNGELGKILRRKNNRSKC